MLRNIVSQFIQSLRELLIVLIDVRNVEKIFGSQLAHKLEFIPFVLEKFNKPFK